MYDTRDNFRKAAILIDSLDRISADALLDQMDEVHANRIRQTVLELDDVSRTERERVMSEFLAAQKPRPDHRAHRAIADDDGIEIEASLAARLSEHHDESAANTATSSERSSPFRFLHEADAAVVATFLDRENPQAVAVVLAHLPPEQSAEVLARLTPNRQTDVVRRIVHLSETPPEVLRDVEHELGSRLSEQLTKAHRREEGLEAIRRILGAADASLRKDLLAHVATDDASLSDQLAVVQGKSHGQARQGETPAEPTVRWRPDKSPPPRQTKWPPITSSKTPATTGEPQALASNAVGGLSQAGRSDASAYGSRFETSAPQPPENEAPAPNARSTPPVEEKSAPAQPVPRVVQSDEPPTPSHNDDPPAAQFDDVARLSNAALATVFTEVDTDVALLALTAADPKFVQRILKQLPRREAKLLAKQLARPVPMRLREIERAQQEVADLAQRLDADGQIDWNNNTERLAAVA